MGGYGSGRQHGKPIADEAKRIDLAWMLREGMAKPGQRAAGTISWTCRDNPAGNISYICDMIDEDDAHLDLHFTVTRHSTGEKTDHVQHVRLTYTEPHFGGKRWWMHCPVNGERVGKLYCPAGGDIFASRTVFQIGYHSQRIASRDKVFEALFRLQKKLGCREGWEQPIRRPKGMWQRTYDRLERRYWELDAQCGREMASVLDRLQR